MASAGIFYSLMVLSLLAPIVLYIVSYMGAVQTQGEQMTVKFEGIELANFADSIALDVPRVLDIAAKRAVVATYDHIDEKGHPVNDSAGEIAHLILYRNFTSGLDAPIMLNVSFEDWMNATEQIGQDHGFITDLSVGGLTVNQSTSFILNFTIELRANITDRMGDMRLYRSYNATTLFSVEGFPDALYPMNTRGIIQRTIRISNVTANDSASLEHIMENGLYVNNSDAPSFFERLQGCTWPKDPDHNCTGKYPGMGMESFIFFLEMQNSSLLGEELRPNSTMIDHWYFNRTLVPGCNVTDVTDLPGGPNDWFKLDVGHNDTYGVGLYGCP